MKRSVAEPRHVEYEELFESAGSKPDSLLLGNGFSMAADPRFSYGSLYEAVRSELSGPQLALFERIGDYNFEQVLRALGTTLATLECYKAKNTAQLVDDRDAIRIALINAVRRNHLADAAQLSDEKKERCADFLRPYRRVFTTNYDFLLYWVLLFSREQSRGTDLLHDGFYGKDPAGSFAELKPYDGIRYLHGALHLFVSAGFEFKRTYAPTGGSLLSQVETGMMNSEYPLFVSESSADKKRQRIRQSHYLEECYSNLHSCRGTMVVYGCSLADSDDHIRRAIARSSVNRLCMGLFGGQGSSDEVTLRHAILEIQKHRWATNRPQIEFLFFDSNRKSPWA
jgi:hypothetical protein